MKFVVTQYGDEVTVRLPWKTRDKIEKILMYGSIAIISYFGTSYYLNHHMS